MTFADTRARPAKRFALLLRMVFGGRPLKRIKVFSQYAYHLALETLNPALSLERPRLKPESTRVTIPARDRTDSIEFSLHLDANARREFDQPDEARRALVTRVRDKYRTDRCWLCDGPLTPIVQIVNSDDVDDFIETSWCASCDSQQYSIMPSKDWIARWYASNWDSSGSTAGKLATRTPTYRYYRRLLPYIGERKLKVLDIGAGYGEKSMPFVREGHEVHCTETTTRRAEYLRDHVTKNVYFGSLDSPAVQTELRRAGPFDLVFTYHVVEHIYNPRAELQILREITAPSAIFYMAIPELYKEGTLNNIYALEHLSSLSRRSAQMLMKQCGFQTVVARDDLFQYYSNYCQYLIGRKTDELVTVEPNRNGEKMARYLATALRLDRIATMASGAFSYGYHGHAALTYGVSAESKAKCREPARHLPLRLYHRALPLFWMAS